MLLSNLIKILKTDASISALLGERIYPGRLPQDIHLPAICVTQLGDDHGYTQQGPEHFVRALVQIDCYGEQYAQAILAAEYTQASIDGYKGNWETSRIGGVFLQDVRDDYEVDIKVYRVSHDYVVWHEEVTP